MAKQRLDIYLAERGLAKSRSEAQALIMAGEVYVNNQKAAKAGEQVCGDEKIEVRCSGGKYVSRGGLKLEKAMEVFPVSPEGRICMDIGASTGGFTDCMLKNGAKKVYAVDVGYGQLAWSLRCDERVVNMERTNIRYVESDDLDDKIEFFSVDVSFISLALVLPAAHRISTDNASGVCLIKPQFEAGRGKVGKKGVVREASVHKEVIHRVFEFTREIGFKILGLDFSPIKGPEGNIEYLMYISKIGNEPEINIDELVDRSHELAR